MRLGRHREAIDDFSLQIKETPPSRADPWNNRAYARALANIDLEEALADVEKALAIEPDNAAYLDTRGYLHHLLGNNEAALADLDRAVEEIAKERRMRFEAGEQAKQEGVSPELVEQMEREFEQNQSVIYHHRGLVHQALGNAEKAEADNKLAEDLGYDPEKSEQ
jgi:tetratricopeptide (TPR) repeat protein